MIVPASASHAAAMAHIHGLAFPPRERWGPDAIAIQLALPGGFGFVADTGGMTLARTAADEAEILTIAVAPEMRRHGLGRALLAAAMAEAAGRGASALFLEVAATNLAAGALYAAAGFVEVGRRPRYYAGGRDALVLRAPLSPSRSAPG